MARKVKDYLKDFGKKANSFDYGSSVTVRDITISVQTEHTTENVPYLLGTITNGKGWTRSCNGNYDMNGFNEVCAQLDMAWNAYKTNAMLSILFE